MARLKQYMIFEKLRECGIEELKIKEESLFDLWKKYINGFKEK